ncbi:MAG: hypothetical protein FWG80_01080 [Alphaproteobacteria bacterium]|nr:hypothetical protein [Alphaproteobacteria bacterium]
MNTFNKTIKITSILAVLTIIPLHRSIAAVACVPKRPTSPTICPSNGYTQCPAIGMSGWSSYRDCTNLSPTNWKLTNCTGSNVSEFSGTSLCSSMNGSPGNIGHPVADDDRYCWCKITSIPGFSVASSAWVFLFGFSSPSDCVDRCAYGCAVTTQDGSDFRSALFAGLSF